MTRVLVCGGSRFADRDAMMAALRPFKNRTLSKPSPHKIIHGGDLDAAALAEEWARCFGVPFRVFLADPAKHGRRAVAIRNAMMIEIGRPDVVIAFGRQGTADIIRRAKAAGIEVKEILE